MDLDNCSVIKVERVSTDTGSLSQTHYSCNVENHTCTIVGHKIYVLGGYRPLPPELDGCGGTGVDTIPELIHVLDTTTWRWEYFTLRGDVMAGSVRNWPFGLAPLVGDKLYMIVWLDDDEGLATFFWDLMLGTVDHFPTKGTDLLSAADGVVAYLEELHSIVALQRYEEKPFCVAVLSLRDACWRAPDTKGTPPPPFGLDTPWTISACSHGKFDVFLFATDGAKYGKLFRLHCVRGSYTWSQPQWNVQPTPRDFACMGSTGNRIFVFGGCRYEKKYIDELFVGDTTNKAGYRLSPRKLPELQRIDRTSKRKSKPIELVGKVPALSRHAAIITKDRMIVLGGRNCPKNDVFVFSGHE